MYICYQFWYSDFKKAYFTQVWHPVLIKYDWPEPIAAWKIKQK
jgi:hypothetical protein